MAWSTIFTNGKGIQMEAEVRPHASMFGHKEVVTLRLGVDEEQVTVHFDTPEELLVFCKKHNIPVVDKR